jgi:hypothetical protein
MTIESGGGCTVTSTLGDGAANPDALTTRARNAYVPGSTFVQVN